MTLFFKQVKEKNEGMYKYNLKAHSKYKYFEEICQPLFEFRTRTNKAILFVNLNFSS